MHLGATLFLLGLTAPAHPLPSLQPLPVAGCHSDVRTHRVPEYRLITPHLHRRGDCAPLISQGGGRIEPERRSRNRDCHQDVRRHPVNGQMLTHRHARDCSIRRVSRSVLPDLVD